MTNRLTKQALSTYTPAVAEVIATPAYSEVRYETVKVLKWTDTYKTIYYQVWNGTRYVSVPFQMYGGSPYYADETVAVYTYHPAVVSVPGRDSSSITDSQLGWNGGAHSVSVMSGDFVLSCTINSDVQGVLVGAQDANAPGVEFNAIQHGILISGGRASVIERGVSKAVGPLFAGDIQVRISRSGGRVSYSAGTDLVYVSESESSTPAVMSVVMYSGSDSLDAPIFTSLQPLSSAGDWGWGDGSGFFALRARSPWGWVGSASINDGEARLSVGLDMVATDEDYASAYLAIDAPILKASGFSDNDSGIAVLAIPLSMVALGISVDIGAAAMTIGTTMRSGDYDYGEASLVIDDIGVFAFSDELPQGYGGADEAAFVGDFYIVDPVAYASIVEGLSVGSSLDLLLSMDINLADHLALIDETSIALIIEALLDNRIGIADASQRSARDISNYIDSVTGLAGVYDFSGSTYSTNITTGAVSRYAGFDFDGFCRVGMQSYGFRKDGLYALGGENDNGTAIGTRADFAAEDFGSAQSKRVGNIFMGISTDGQVYVRTTEDGDQQMTYRAYQRRSEFRADMQRGRASRNWRLRLEIVDGTYTELDNIEWVITPTGRRSS